MRFLSGIVFSSVIAGNAAVSAADTVEDTVGASVFHRQAQFDELELEMNDAGTDETGRYGYPYYYSKGGKSMKGGKGGKSMKGMKMSKGFVPPPNPRPYPKYTRPPAYRPPPTKPPTGKPPSYYNPVYSPYHAPVYDHPTYEKPVYEKPSYDYPVYHPPTYNDDGNDDYGIRFSKVSFDDPHADLSPLPLRKEDYPLNIDTYWWLTHSNCYSVTHPEHCEECQGYDMDELIHVIGGHPSHPSKNPNSPYWQELVEVARVQELRKRNVPAGRVLPLPKIWKDISLDECAEAVHDEYPASNQQMMVEYIYKQGAKFDNSTLPQKSKVELIRGRVMLGHLNTWVVAKIGTLDFALKWYKGRARPEEVIYKISNREIYEGVPRELLDLYPPNSLGSAEAFTAYPEGCPRHPSWPAMHSAGSTLSLWLAVVMNLSKEQHCQAMLMDWATSYCRTVAGVHYVSDNMAGLKLGTYLIEKYLPGYLNEVYGSDINAVKAKIQKVKVDWDNFLESDCYRSNIIV